MKNILKKAKEHIEQLYQESINDGLLLHNWSFKERLLSNAEVLIEKEDVTEGNKEIIILVILFMDIHLLKKDLDVYSTIEQMRLFLKSENYDQGNLDKVEELLLFTANNATPETKEEKIVNDIQYSFFSEKDYTTLSELWREELQYINDKEISVKEWRQHQLQLFRGQHKFYTEYALDKWLPKKKKNLKKLVKAKKKRKKLVLKERMKAKFKDKIVDRGVQTLYRVTLRNHIKLSDIADTKANILLSVNAIIISLALANLIPKLDNPSNQYLIYPTFIFIIFCVISMIMSIMATRPNVTSGEFTRQDVENKKVNLLFFGNFHKMKLENYEWAMGELIMDRNYIYKSLTKDLYYLGVVLERKYRLLRWTYTVFMIGMVVSVIIFSISLKFFGPERVLPVDGLINQ